MVTKLGVILAGGKGTRLFPLTQNVNKHLLPIYNKPMIYYPISNLLMLGCEKIIILTTSSHANAMRGLINTLKDIQIEAELKFQGDEQGIPSALLDAIIDENFNDVYTILGDNIFFGNRFINDVLDRKEENVIVTKKVKDPSSFGVLSRKNSKIEVIEKPKSFLSNEVVTGFYKFNKKIKSLLREAVPSQRGETEISDILNALFKKDLHSVGIIDLNRATLWLDAGNFENLAQSNTLVSQIVERQGQDFGCIEEIALERGYIEKGLLQKVIEHYPKNNYRDYIN
ncbi:MAG: hypothetical protein CBB97_04520, partial [Candidatus Endolissoclinum sp. TMED37]